MIKLRLVAQDAAIILLARFARGIEVAGYWKARVYSSQNAFSIFVIVVRDK